ncbi:transcriptional regulator [Orenia marismortui]|uniref:transcriptional regulator n=1 Tax=Orenia marismortui TaxID=46469 RepID=UPI0010646505
MKIINQTNRTLLFEEVNPEKLDLITLVGDVKELDSLDDDKINEINDHLLVESFEEFLRKFSPTIYSYYNAANQKVVYTSKRPEGVPNDGITEIKLNENNDFLKMLFTLIDTKKSQGTENVDFKFENILDMISPKKVMEDIKQVRKEINYLYSKYEDLDDEDPKKLDLGDKLNIKFEEASQNYNNVLGMLPLAIEDIKTRLLLGGSQEDSEAEEIQIGMLTMGDDGELKILEAPKEEEKALAERGEEQRNALVEVFEEDYEEITENPTGYVKDLVVRTFAPISTPKTDIDVEKEVQNYNNYLEFYKNTKDDFVKAAKPLIEKLLGIKMFFEQYETKNNNMKPELLVTNSKPEMLVKTNNKPRLETFLNTVNAKNNFAETIWFGIVPNIELDASNKVQTRRQRFKGTNKTKKAKGNTLETLTAILDLCKDYKVQVFFNFEANENTTFNDMATKGVDKYIEKSKMLTNQEYSEYAVPCLPNFTVIPKDKSGVVLDSKMLYENEGVVLSKAEEDILKLWLEGVYIDASYVAAGLVAAYQCPDYLRERFRKVSTSYPGVRFDIESGDNALKATTTLAKEISGFTNVIKGSINRNNFGFVFSSENNQLDGKLIKRITVYKARSLGMTDDIFDSIYKTIMSTYIERMLRFKTSDFKEDKIIKFFSNNPKSQKSEWISNKGYVNSILQEGDDINYNIDPESNLCQLDLAFNGNVKNLEVEITKSSAD